MEPWADDLADDLQSLSFASTATTTITTTTLHRSTSSGSSTTLTPAPSTHASFSSKSGKLQQCLSLSDLQFSVRLGSGDIGSVYLAELKKSK